MNLALALVRNTLALSTSDAVHAVLFLAAAGFLLWLLLTYVPMKPPFPTLITAFVVVVIILWLLSRFGMF